MAQQILPLPQAPNVLPRGPNKTYPNVLNLDRHQNAQRILDLRLLLHPVFLHRSKAKLCQKA